MMAQVSAESCACSEVVLLDHATTTVTLVHGTFKQHAAWMQSGQPLPDALAEKTDARTTEVHRFCWGGENRHWARVEGGRALQAHLLGLVERLPDAEHHVIAHSHGGNVALYAIRGDKATEVHEDLRKVQLVTLGTPFLSAERRPTGLASRWIIAAAMAAAVLMLGILAFLFDPPDDESAGLQASDVWVFGAYFLAFGLLVIPAVRSGRAYQGGASRLGAAPRGLFELVIRGPADLSSFAVPTLPKGMLLAVIGRGDEAGGILSGAQFLSWLWDRLLERASRWVKWSVGLIFSVFVVGGFVLGAVEGAGTDTTDFERAIEPVFTVASLLILALVGLVMLLVALIGISNAPFGNDTLLLNYHVRMTADAAPLGVSRVATVGGLSRKQRAHSLHASEQALEHIVNRVTGGRKDLEEFFAGRTDLNTGRAALTRIAGIGEERQRLLAEQDIRNYETLSHTSATDLATIAGVSAEMAEGWIVQAKTLQDEQ